MISWFKRVGHVYSILVVMFLLLDKGYWGIREGRTVFAKPSSCIKGEYIVFML